MTSSDTWMGSVLKFIATSDERFLADAKLTCPDSGIRRLLERSPAKPIPLDELKQLSDRSRRAGRPDEADIIDIVGLNSLANLVTSRDKDHIQLGLDVCSHVLQLSRRDGFSGCRARFSYLLGQRAHESGDYNLARQLLTESESCYGKLCESDARTYSAAFADALCALACLYADLKDFSQACQRLLQAIGVLRDLAAATPRKYLLKLASALNNLGTFLGEQRRYSEACDSFREAEDLLQGIEGPAAKSALASTLNNKARAMAESGHLEAGIVAAKKSVQMSRELAEESPALHMPKLAAALVNLSKLSGEGGSVADAFHAGEEAISILTELFGEAPQRHGPGLAAAMTNVGNALREAGHAHEATQLHKKAADIYGALARVAPAVFRSDMALFLSNLAASLDLDGDRRSADEVADQAIRAAESADKDIRFLSKGSAKYAYLRHLACCVEGGDLPAAFRVLAALRAGGEGLHAGSLAGLDETTEALQEVEQRTGRTVCVVAAQSLPHNQTCLAMLDSAGMRSLWVDGNNQLRRAASVLLSEITHNPSSADPQHPTSPPARLQGIGGWMWRALPKDYRDAFSPHGNRCVLISGDGFWNAFPWEALAFGDGRDDFLGLHQPLARWSSLISDDLKRLAVRQFGGRDRAAAIICPWDTRPPLPGARDEAIALARLFRRIGYRLRPGKESCVVGNEATDKAFGEILVRSPSIVHFAGHGAIDGNEETLVLWSAGTPGEVVYFGRRQIAGLKTGGRRKLLMSGPLVVLNSCMSGRSRFYGGQREDLAAAFLEAGAEAVIGCPRLLSDEVAMHFGEDLYGVADEDECSGLGEHLVTVRRRLHARFLELDAAIWPMWTLLQYHGNPFAVLPHCWRRPAC